MRISSNKRLFGIFVLVCAGLQAQSRKMDAALSDLIDSARTGLPALPASVILNEVTPRYSDSVLADAERRILVDIYLDGTVDVTQFAATLPLYGASVTGVNASFRFGAISAYVPVGLVESLAGARGLNVIKLAMKPQTNTGAATSQGTVVLRSNTANSNGFTGAGITVGVLSDSYDSSPTSFSTIRASNDITSGDLPTPKFVIDLPPTANNTDEGRGMMQIVYDVAPGSSLCFATAFSGEAAFASNIRTLRTNATCAADVIVDDVFYYDEPFFSDGQVAQAVNDVSTSTILAGKKVAYFSSAGNQGALAGGGSIDVPAATFSAAPTGLGNISLATAATCASSPSSGSTKASVVDWLDYGGGTFVKSVSYNSAGSVMIFQWDDLFYSGAVTTDLNWFMFNSAGTCVFTFATNSIAADAPIEIINLGGGSSGTYRIMIGRTGAGSRLATRVRMLNLGGFGGAAFTSTSPATFGHSAAASANSVAAYRYDVPPYTLPYTPIVESFTSPGPVTIAFDALGNRLAVAETRKKPDIAAPDGGDTTFFYPGTNPEGNAFPNFFGTSAAAPHAAGVAALLLQKGGGPGSLTPPQIKSYLQTTAPARVPPTTGNPAVKGWNLFDGFGLIDALNALAKIP